MNKKYIVICAVLVPFVLFTIDVFAQYGDFTRYIFLRRSEKLIRLEDGIDLSRQSLPRTIINRELNFPQGPGTLKNIDFSRCNLYDSDLSETDFVNCSFRYANLGSVTALNSFFGGCDFTDADITNSDVFLSKEQLMTTASFKRKDLTGYRFQGDFSGVDFSGFDLSGARFVTDRGVSSFNPTFQGCNFSDAKISATAQYHSIPPKTLVFNRMTREQLLSTRCFRQKCVINVNLSGFDFSNMDLSKMNFTGCVFLSANFQNADLTDTVFSDCDFVGLATNYFTLDQTKSTWNYKVGRLEGIELPEKLQEKFDAERQAKENVP